MNKKRAKIFLLLFGLFFMLNCNSQSKFQIKEGFFGSNRKEIQLICGEMHYPRVPKEYWTDRLKRAIEMGLNTISMLTWAKSIR